MKNTLQKRKELLNFLAYQAKSQGLFQEEWAAKCDLKQSSLSRMLSGKYTPTLDNLIKLADVIGFDIAAVKKYINEKIEDEFIQPKFLLAPDPESKQLYILHRHYPSCLIQVTNHPEPRFIVADLYDDMDNPHDILNMPFVEDAKTFFFSQVRD